MKVTFSGRSFHSKKALREELNAIIYNQPLYVDFSKEHHDFIVGMFEALYPNWTARTLGMTPVRIWMIFEIGSRHMNMAFEDGRVIMPAWNKCLQKRNSVLLAMRLEIKNQCADYTARYFKDALAPCELTGRLLRASECDVDHVSPQTFKSLAETWMRENELVAEEIQLIEAPGGFGSLLEPALGSSWREFHKRQAVLRVIDRKEHHRISAEARRKTRPGKSAGERMRSRRPSSVDCPMPECSEKANCVDWNEVDIGVGVQIFEETYCCSKHGTFGFHPGDGSGSVTKVVWQA